jgi:hypothetical protein
MSATEKAQSCTESGEVTKGMCFISVNQSHLCHSCPIHTNWCSRFSQKLMPISRSSNKHPDTSYWSTPLRPFHFALLRSRWHFGCGMFDFWFWMWDVILWILQFCQYGYRNKLPSIPPKAKGNENWKIWSRAQRFKWEINLSLNLNLNPSPPSRKKQTVFCLGEDYSVGLFCFRIFSYIWCIGLPKQWQKWISLT